MECNGALENHAFFIKYSKNPYVSFRVLTFAGATGDHEAASGETLRYFLSVPRK